MPDIAGLVRPSQPGVMFDVYEPKLYEVARFVNKARAALISTRLQLNPVQIKVYKKCEELRKLLWKLLKVVWRQEIAS